MDIINKYFPELTSTQKEQFAALQELYATWNEQINVISRKDIESLYERHILHSLGIAKVMPFASGSKIADVGTGGGFPGVPLAILFPDCEFTLVDSIGKKLKVINEVCAGAGIKNVTTIHSRFEAVPGQFHFIVSRAVTRLAEFIPWTKGKFLKEQTNLFPNGILYLKGGDLTDEIKEASMPAKLFALKDTFEEEFFETKYVVYVRR